MTPSNIGQNIRQARKARGITQEQLAAELYVSRQTVSSWENARTQPDYETLQKLADLLCVSMSDLFGIADQPAPDAPVTAEALSAEIIAEESLPEEAAPSSPPASPAQSAVPPVLPEVVQPVEKQDGKPRAGALSLTAAVCLLACVLLAAWFLMRQNAYSPEQFAQTAAPAAGQAYVTLYAKDSRVNLAGGKSYPTWSYNLFLREDHGIGFQIDNLRRVYFFGDGHTVALNADTADIAQAKQTSHINGYGLMRLFYSYTPTKQNPSHPTGVGILLEGRDDGMHAQRFTLYIPFEPYP